MQQTEPRRMHAVILMAGLLGFGLTAVQAAIHPDALRKAAPEILQLFVDKVQITKDGSLDDGPGKIQIIAYVMVATKTQTKLRPGDKITISYERNLKAEVRARKSYDDDTRGTVGAQFFHAPDIPAEGDRIMAYLEPDDDEEKRRARIYHPDAHQYSFVVLEPKAAK